MKKSENINPEASKFVNSVVKGKNVDANDILEKIVRRKVEKHIRKVLKNK
jgi:hypothetical protein